MVDQKGRVAIVTGGSRGIGREVALSLAAKGVALFIVADGTEEELNEVSRECAAFSGTPAFGVAINLSATDAAERMVTECLEKFGRVDILVNNASARRRRPFGEFSLEDYELLQAINIRSPFFACQAVLPEMKRRGSGCIVNVASQFGTAAFMNHALYGMTKAALIYLTRAVAFECASLGISVNCVSPGPTETAYLVERLKDYPELRREMKNNVPLGRFIKPEEVAEVIVFLAMGDNRGMQGHNLNVDGGWLIH